ncbi:hypothetical protein [Lacisediminimonas profundi]|uniref:hypothetical protein n=1 Tax=Lacisediminimonas profundi TaxID=2603856 RepID=UPI00188425A3|nr:hypothetical protein [Lacisediminimonas profundi]
MKTTSAILLALLASSTFAADVQHQGYVRNHGTYVQPHMQTAPDSSRLNNYSTQGNVNPYTGQAGTVNLYPSYQAPAPRPAPNNYQPPQRSRF